MTAKRLNIIVSMVIVLLILYSGNSKARSCAIGTNNDVVFYVVDNLIKYTSIENDFKYVKFIVDEKGVLKKRFYDEEIEALVSQYFKTLNHAMDGKRFDPNREDCKGENQGTVLYKLMLVDSSLVDGVSLINYLLNYRASPDAKSTRARKTALMRAVELGQLDYVKTLTQKSNLLVKDKNGLRIYQYVESILNGFDIHESGTYDRLRRNIGSVVARKGVKKSIFLEIQDQIRLTPISDNTKSASYKNHVMDNNDYSKQISPGKVNYWWTKDHGLSFNYRSTYLAANLFWCGLSSSNENIVDKLMLRINKLPFSILREHLSHIYKGKNNFTVCKDKGEIYSDNSSFGRYQFYESFKGLSESHKKSLVSFLRKRINETLNKIKANPLVVSNDDCKDELVAYMKSFYVVMNDKNRATIYIKNYIFKIKSELGLNTLSNYLGYIMFNENNK